MPPSQNVTQPSSVPPKGTKHKQKTCKVLLQSSARLTDEQREAIQKEVERLPELVKANFKTWTNGAQLFQLTCMGAQALGQDVVLHAATGAGKTGIAAGPHLLPSNQGKVTLVVSPLLSLHEEQVTTFQEEFHLKAMSINSASGGCKKETLTVSLVC
jgi:replicative superfamily II helicase